MPGKRYRISEVFEGVSETEDSSLTIVGVLAMVPSGILEKTINRHVDAGSSTIRLILRKGTELDAEVCRIICECQNRAAGLGKSLRLYLESGIRHHVPCEVYFGGDDGEGSAGVRAKLPAPTGPTELAKAKKQCGSSMCADPSH